MTIFLPEKIRIYYSSRFFEDLFASTAERRGEAPHGMTREGTKEKPESVCRIWSCGSKAELKQRDFQSGEMDGRAGALKS